MSTSKIAAVFESVGAAVRKHSPEILTGIGIAGMIMTTVLAVKDTPKALRLIEKTEAEKGEKLTVKETVKTTWKCYIPAAVTGTISVACLVGASSVNLRRNAALATAYKLSETALTEYRDKVVETIGEKKEKTVREAIAKDKLEKDPVDKKEIIITGGGNTRCYDMLCGRYFESSREKLERVVNVLNRRLLDEMYISLNEFYNEVGLDDVAAGHELGWHIDQGKGIIELEFSSILDSSSTPCLAVGFYTPPKYNFRY